jgi:hypothetical protein
VRLIFTFAGGNLKFISFEIVNVIRDGCEPAGIFTMLDEQKLL